MARDALTTSDLARVVGVYRGALAEHRAALNRLNVYPVPDGDTGTNMSLTLDAVQAELAATPPPVEMAALARALSHGSLMGARGNSGVILSQILRGMTEGFTSAGPPAAGQRGPGLQGRDLADAFTRASESAYAAVSNPVEGTILSVAKAAATAAEQAVHEGRQELVAVLEAARAAAAAALATTTEQLPALKAAGVVDAGGAGLLLLFDSFLEVAAGTPVEAPPRPPGLAPAPPVNAGDGGALKGGEHGRPAESIGELRYEVMFFLDAPDEAVPPFRSLWAGYGGSVVVVGGDGLYNCHIHTDDVGAAIESALEIGRPRQIRVTDLREQVEEERWVRQAAASGGQSEGSPPPVTTAVVAVCAGEGVKRIFQSLGVARVVPGGESANPSTAEVLDAVTAAPAEQVVVLPNNLNVVAVAEQAAAHSAKKVRVVPSAGVAEGFAALLAYDPEADVDTNAEAMASAAAHVLAGEVARASRDTVTAAGPVRAGDWIGLSRHTVKVVAPAPSTPADAAIALLDALIPASDDHEIVTVIEGEGSQPSETRRIVEWLSAHRPEVNAEVHHGGQPLYPYLFSIE